MGAYSTGAFLKNNPIPKPQTSSKLLNRKMEAFIPITLTNEVLSISSSHLSSRMDAMSKLMNAITASKNAQ